MSTTAEKEVAIDYSEVRKKADGDENAQDWRGTVRGLLPMVLVVRVSAVDRGACIRDFSQYMQEVEYLWVPGSYLQQVCVGPGLDTKFVVLHVSLVSTPECSII